VARQLRSSGGLWFSLKGVNLYMDPGPGALVRCLASKPRLDPTKLDGILLSHKHLDHSGDINVLIEAMTEGGYAKKGVVFAPADALEEDPVVFRYVRRYAERVELLKADSTYTLGGLNFSTAGRHEHSVETYGVNFHLSGATLSYITDTKYYPELLSQYPGEILMLNVVLLAEVPDRKIDHFSLVDVRRILGETRARVIILTHFGMRLLQAKPWEVAEQLSAEFGKKVIAARDGMTLDVDEHLQ
jgi:ribonuclease BN (tRNA processing enzyme)